VEAISAAKVASPTTCTRTSVPGTRSWNCVGQRATSSSRAASAAVSRPTMLRTALTDL
jgi:hypothetical protein